MFGFEKKMAKNFVGTKKLGCGKSVHSMQLKSEQQLTMVEIGKKTLKREKEAFGEKNENRRSLEHFFCAKVGLTVASL